MYPKLTDLLNDLLGTHWNLPVQTYGFFVALAFATAGWLLFLELRRKERTGLLRPVVKTRRKGKQAGQAVTIHPYTLTGDFILLAFFFGILGSKLFDIMEHLQSFLRDPIRTLFSFSGLAFYGGLITAALAIAIYGERNRIPWPVLGDAVAPALMIAYGIGRIGCQLAGDGCWGIVNTEPKPDWLAFLPDWAWSFSYPHNVINEGVPIPSCAGDHCHVLEQPVFPTPLYETFMATVFFFILWGIRKRKLIPGILFSIYLIMNGFERFAIESIRVNRRYDIFGLKVTQAEAIAAGLILLGVIFIIYFRRKYKKPQQADATG